MDNDFGFEFKDYLILGTWTITVAGWAITNFYANQRERRKEARSEIEACAKMAHELLDLSRQYYTKDASNESVAPLGAKIRFEVQRLFKRAERIDGKYKKFAAASAAEGVFDAITGGDFDGANRKAFDINCETLLNIESEVHTFIDALEDGFFTTFK